MKYLILFIPLFIFADIYMAKIEPFEKHLITSKISGQIVYLNNNLEFKISKNEIIIKIDDEVSKIKYETAKENYEIKKGIYDRTLAMTTKSKNEKDKEKLVFLEAKEYYIQAKDDFLNRTIKANNLYISKIQVNKGSYVNPGTILFEAYDISKAKIVIYVSKEDIKDIENKKIIVEGADDNFKLYNYSKIADDVYVSSYRVELVGRPPKLFSKIAKVEIK